MNTKILKLFFLPVFIFSLWGSIIESSEADLNLAFDMREFVLDEEPALSPDMQTLVYSVRQRPSETNLDTRRLPNGTPTTYAGSRIFVTRLDTKETIEIGPAEGNCWHPVWSPEGDKIAFYSDADGSQKLWIYDSSSKQSRTVSDEMILTQNFLVDAPCWSPDGTSIYVPISPKKEKRETEKTDTKRDDAEITVKVLTTRDTEEGKGETADQNPSRIEIECNAHLTSIRIAEGTCQTIVPAEMTPRPAFFTLSPSGKWLSYISVPREMNNPCYNAWDIAVAPSDGTGEIITIDKDITGLSWMLGAYHIWHPTEDILVYLKDKKLYLVTFDQSGPQKPKQLGSHLGKDFLFFPFTFSEDGSMLIVGVRPAGSEDTVFAKPTSLISIPLHEGECKEWHLEKEWEFIRYIDPSTCLLEETSTKETAIARIDWDRGG